MSARLSPGTAGQGHRRLSPAQTRFRPATASPGLVLPANKVAGHPGACSTRTCDRSVCRRLQRHHTGYERYRVQGRASLSPNHGSIRVMPPRIDLPLAIQAPRAQPQAEGAPLLAGIWLIWAPSNEICAGHGRVVNL